MASQPVVRMNLISQKVTNENRHRLWEVGGVRGNDAFVWGARASRPQLFGLWPKAPDTERATQASDFALFSPRQPARRRRERPGRSRSPDLNRHHL